MQVEQFCSAQLIRDSPAPLTTPAVLMRHRESAGDVYIVIDVVVLGQRDRLFWQHAGEQHAVDHWRTEAAIAETMETSNGFAQQAGLRHVDHLRKLCALREAERASSPENGPAYRQLVEFGHQLFEEGREGLMAATYDATVERYGHRGVFGASPAWTGIGTWSA